MKAMRHTGIVVNDLEKAIHFYRDILGLKVQREMTETGEYIDNLFALEGVRVKTVKMAANDGNLLELLYCESHSRNFINRGICDTGYSHIAFTVESLDFEYDRLKKDGVKFNSAPQVSPDSKAKVAFCYDCEGNLIELVEELT